MRSFIRIYHYLFILSVLLPTSFYAMEEGNNAPDQQLADIAQPAPQPAQPVSCDRNE